MKVETVARFDGFPRCRLGNGQECRPQDEVLGFSRCVSLVVKDANFGPSDIRGHIVHVTHHLRGIVDRGFDELVGVESMRQLS
jgi:hypothetical protein